LPTGNSDSSTVIVTPFASETTILAAQEEFRRQAQELLTSSNLFNLEINKKEVCVSLPVNEVSKASNVLLQFDQQLRSTLPNVIKKSEVIDRTLKIKVSIPAHAKQLEIFLRAVGLVPETTALPQASVISKQN
jgi:hypothetical protein